MDGIILSIRTDLASHVSKGKYEIKPVDSEWQRIDLIRYEEKIIRVEGNLLHGDRFIVDPENIKVVGSCDSK